MTKETLRIAVMVAIVLAVARFALQKFGGPLAPVAGYL